MMTATSPFPDLDDIRRAATRIAPHVHRTPVMTCTALDRMLGAELHFKCEQLQKAGAFKFRGATNAVFSLSDEQAARGVATHSSGNHAQALALAARLRGVPAHVVMPTNAATVKREAVRAYGATIHDCAPTQEAREQGAASLELRAALPAATWERIAARLPRGALLVGLTSIHWREAWKYGERAFRYCQHDVGHAIAALGDG